MKTVILIFVLLAVVFARGPNNNQQPIPAWWQDGKTFKLKSSNFEGMVGQDKFAVVQFCTHHLDTCAPIQKEFERLTDEYMGVNTKRNDVLIAKIDVWTYASVAQDFHVKDFPAVVFFKKGTTKEYEEFEGNFVATEMMTWIEKQIEKNTPKNEATEKKDQEAKQETKQTEQQKNEKPKTETKEQKNQQASSATTTTTTVDGTQEIKITLNETLLHTEIQNLQSRMSALEKNIETKFADTFKRLEEVVQSEIDVPKSSITHLLHTTREYGNKIDALNQGINSVKRDLQLDVKQHSDKHVGDLKNNIETIRSKVFEPKIEPPNESNTGTGIIFLFIGVAIGGAVGFFVSNMKSQRKDHFY